MCKIDPNGVDIPCGSKAPEEIFREECFNHDLQLGLLFEFREFQKMFYVHS